MSETLDGMSHVRMTWNAWPNSQVEACVIPIAATITPIVHDLEIAVLHQQPLVCNSCSCVLNPRCRVDYAAKTWIYPICFQSNQFPVHYDDISETNVPVEVQHQHTTIEYAVPAAMWKPPVFLFVCDACLIQEELQFVRLAILRALQRLPGHALIGFVSFWNYVQVHELGRMFPENIYIFRGTKEVTKQQVLHHLGVLDGFSISNRFLIPAWGYVYTLSPVLRELQPDPWSVPGNRASRCTGVALSVAAGLLDACQAGTGARIIALVGGPCTEGPGMIVSKDLSERLRSHHDLKKHTAPHFHKAVKFYENLSKQLVSQGHVLDLFSSSLDQVGVAEMKVAVERTGGLVVLGESFGHRIFVDSFLRIFEDGERSLGLSFKKGLLVPIQLLLRAIQQRGRCVASTRVLVSQFSLMFILVTN